MPSREEIINSLEGCMDVHRTGLWSSGCMLCAYEKQSNPKCFMDLTKDVIELLREQTEIVRCKDCKYYIDETGVCDLYHAHGCAEIWYCADGERR